MLYLLLSNVRYRLPHLAWGAGIGFALATALNLVLPALGIEPGPEDDFELAYLVPVFLFFGASFAELGALFRDARERRVAQHVILPVTKAGVGLAAALTPVASILLTLAAAEATMVAILVAKGLPIVGWKLLFLCFFAGQMLVALQFPLLIAGLATLAQGSRALRVAIFGAGLLVIVVIGLRSLARYVDLDPALAERLRALVALDPESVTSNLVLLGISAALVLANVLVFLRRRSFA